MSVGFGKQEGKSSSKQKQEPWGPTIPHLQDYLGQIGDLSTQPMTGTQLSSISDLQSIYGEGSPYTGMLSDLAGDFAAGPNSRSGQIDDAYASLQTALTPYAEGKFLDFKENPYINDMLTQVGDSVQQRINGMFSGAGRDLSGMNQKAVGQGVTQAQLPLLFDMFNQQQDKQLNAANALFSGGMGAAQGAQGLDTSALQTRAGALPIMDAALASEMWGPQGIFNLEQTVADAPFERLGLLGNLLLPVAQLGQQQTGSGKTSQSGFNVGAKLLSDERLKEDLEQIGTLADGTPIYRFRYQGEDTVRIGMSAQELEDISPESVSEYEAPQAGTEDGRVKYVDMDKATRRSADMMRYGPPPGAGASSGPAMPPPMPRPMLEDEQYMRQAAA